ncbi:MAG TPA: hypothetical protein VF202_00895 [Trueperaceae bacterium]
MRALALLLLALCAGWAGAARIVIDAAHDPESRLEIRSVTLPGGEAVQVYVLTGRGLTVRIDDDVLVADHVEFDLTRRIVRVVGRGSFTRGAETIEGDDLVIDLGRESLEGSDVLIVTPEIDVSGDSASRVPGMIAIALGEFSPCGRCGQEVEDYGFRAERIELYPGDRLVAHGVTVLIRERPAFAVPLLVLPLGPEDRRPRLLYETGTATSRARIELTWPYVAGPDARGSVTLRYHADVEPGASRLGDALLGGAVRRSYFGVRLDHAFYTERGAGDLVVDLTPGYVEPDGWRPPRWTVTFSYADDPLLGPPTNEVLLQRDDEERPFLWEATLRSRRVGSGVDALFSSQVFVDLEPADEVDRPSYAGGRTPLLTPARLELRPEVAPLELGALTVDDLLLDLGVFEDRSNPTNRSAALTPTVGTGRALESHALSLGPLDLWSGASLSARTDFSGYYYGTGERQVDWLTRATAEQSFGGVGSLSLTFTRDVTEGETPFSFDTLAYRARTDLLAALLLDPAPWLRFQQRGGYVFLDDRNPDSEGWAPLETTVTLLGNVDWVTLTARNAYDLQDGDPGVIDLDLALRSRGTFRAGLEVSHVEDLKVTEDRITGLPTDDSETSVRLTAGVPGAFDLEVRTAYRYAPPPPEPGEPPDHFDDLSLSLTIGTLGQDDGVPGLSLDYARDLDRGELSAFGVELTGRVGPVNLYALERLSLPAGRVAQSRLRAEWRGAVAAEARGLEWLPPGAVGLPTPDPYSRDLEFAVEDAPTAGAPTWRAAFSTRFDPALEGGAGGYRGSTLTARALLDSRVIGPARLSVDGFAEVSWRDSLQPVTYLRRANLQFGVDLYERVGLQGTVGYAASFSQSTQEVTSAQLTLTDVALVVRPLDELYLGVVVDDVWDLTGNDPSRSFALQPEFTVVWNRCCWALYGSWDSATGQVSITLTTPGADQGLQQVFGTGLLLPGSEP